MENQNKEQAVNINIANYTGEKPVEVIIRKGEAATPLETKAPLAINFTGTLSSVTEWLSKRVSEINQKTAHVEVDRDSNYITLILDENDPYKKRVSLVLLISQRSTRVSVSIMIIRYGSLSSSDSISECTDLCFQTRANALHL